jgi:hypothetical protein
MPPQRPPTEGTVAWYRQELQRLDLDSNGLKPALEARYEDYKRRSEVPADSEALMLLAGSLPVTMLTLTVALCADGIQVLRAVIKTDGPQV